MYNIHASCLDSEPAGKMVPFSSRLFGETLGRISNSPIETLAQKQTKSSFSNPGNSGFSMCKVLGSIPG
jgi:hypothetical protein